MNERRTKGWFGERGSIGRPLFGRLASLSRRSVPSALLLLAFALLPCARVEGAQYTTMGNDRILLMNNWTKGRVSIKNQGYYDTGDTNATYWVHVGGLHRTYSTGTNHFMYAQDGTLYWQLFNCRAGSGEGASGLNWLPTSQYSLQSGTGRSIVKASASVIMRNNLGSQVYSPYYEDGIGTIYFDAVNGYNKVGADVPTLQVQLATRMKESALMSGKTLASTDTLPEDLIWSDPIPLTVFTVENGALSSTSTEMTDLELQAPSNGGSNYFYRVRATLNIRQPVRFRIIRTTVDTTQTSVTEDDVGLILIDNIIASFPVMSFNLHSYSPGYDAGLKGSDVLGCIGDFAVPFLSVNMEGVQPWAYYEWLTNGASRVLPALSNPKLHYRWRYLNQIEGNWKTLPMEIKSGSLHIGASAGEMVDLTDGVGDLEYFYTADVASVFYNCLDFTFGTPIGWGAGWSEEITSITNRAAYAATDGVPSGGTDYFVRIREGESNMEWVELQGTLTVTNKVKGSNEVVRLLTPDGTVPRMTLVGDHSWRYHYQIPTNAIGGKLAFRLVTKEYYTNATDATEWLIRTNTLKTVEETVTDIPYTATLEASNPNDISVILDDASTHLKIEYNDEQRAFSLSHASYQTFNLWTDATDGFRGNVMDGNGVSNSGVSDNKKRYDAPFDSGWELCPEQNNYWLEAFTKPAGDDTTTYPVNEWFSVHKTPNGWTAHNSRFVEGARGDDANLALALDGLGEGALALENFNKSDLPLGLDTVAFTARIAQPIEFEDFATYMDGLSCSNYAISAKVTMSHKYETTTVKPDDMSPVYPSISFVGYHRGKQGCYEFRMTRTGAQEITLALYKWTKSGSSTKSRLLTSKNYTTNLLVPSTQAQASGSYWTSAYFLLYTLPSGSVQLEGHLASSCTQASVESEASNQASLKQPVIFYTDPDPDVLAKGGSYGIGSTDCYAGFGQVSYHENVTRANDASSDASIGAGKMEGPTKLRDEWDFYDGRWELDTVSRYMNDGGFSAVIPSNQVVEVWLSDTTASGGEWVDTGYSVTVNSFSTNKFTVSPRMPGSWKVRLQTGQEESAGVVVDDVEISPWEGVETWGRNGSAYQLLDDWVYTKAWICASADITYNNKPYYLPDANMVSVGTNGYALIFDKPGTYDLVPNIDMQIDRALVVGGGGAGGWTLGGGGGGGGVLEGDWTTNMLNVSAGTHITVVVGAGGNNYYVGNNDGANWKAGGAGGSSSLKITLPFVSLTAKGGGGGAGWNQRNASSGNATGGGAAQGNDNAYYSNRATGTAGQGNSGGRAYGDRAGGGGGADLTAAGEGQDGNATDDKAGDGGAGRASDITGTIRYYGGGGGGGGGDGNKSPNSALGGAGGIGGGGNGPPARAKLTDREGMDGKDGLGGGGAGGSHSGAAGTNAGGKGGSGVVILRVRTATRQCVLQPSRGVMDYPMGLRSPYINEGMSLFTYSYANADSNCVLLVQIATNMTPSQGASTFLPGLTESVATNAGWTTVARHDFSTMTNKGQLASGTLTTFISLRQHRIYDMWAGGDIYTNVCGAIRVIVDPDIVSNVVNATREQRDALVDYGKITITKAYCYNEPALNMRSWFGWNVHTEGWDGAGGAGRFAYLTDWPDGLSIALNFSAKVPDNDVTKANTLGIGLGEPDKATEYAGQNPFIQCAALTNGIGTVSFRARLFDTNAPNKRAVITLYGGTDAAADQPTTEAQAWHILTNFVVTSPTYQAFTWESKAAKSDYQAIRLEAAGARWGRYPSAQAAAWEWEDLDVKQQPVNRVFIDEVSVSELIVPRLKFLDVRPFRTNLGTEDICVITNIMSADQQPLMLESWGFQCRLEPQQMADELDTSSIRVWVEAYRGEYPWGYEQWKDLPVDNKKRFSAELQRVSDSNLVFRSYYMRPESIMTPEREASTVYQYVMRATYRDKSGSNTEYPAVLEASDWTVPEWYRGSTVGAGNDSGDPSQFAAYTILDSISPYRAWINEVNTCDAENSKGLNQFIELAVPQNSDLTRWQLKVTAYNLKSATLATIGVDDGVRSLKSKVGEQYGVDITNHYTFVSLCSPAAKGNVKNDGYWKSLSECTLSSGSFKYYYPYGIQLVCPSGIIEHEIVVQGTNTSAGTYYEAEDSGTNLLARLRAAVPGSQWLYAGEDLPSPNTSLGVFRSHGEDVDPSCWTNYMFCTPAAINRLKDGTMQDVPDGYFLEPLGENLWIYSTLLKPEYMKQFYGGNDMGTNAVIVVQKGKDEDVVTNIVLTVKNWYQVGRCTNNGMEIPDARGQKGTYTLNLVVTNSMTILIDAEPDDRLASDWNLTAENSYSSAVLEWLKACYPDYGPDDLSRAHYYDLGLNPVCPLTLTEMYWLNIPPVHAHPHYGGSNYWFVAGTGTFAKQVSGGATEQDIEPHVTTNSVGTIVSNVYLTVTMMITNTATSEAWAPYCLNGHEYTATGSAEWNGSPSWTSVVFAVTGALQRPGYESSFLPLQQYVFNPNSFGDPGDPNRKFQTRIEVIDPYSPNSMGNYYHWTDYRNVYNVFYRWIIKSPPDGRVSTIPLTPNWTPVTSPVVVDP